MLIRQLIEALSDPSAYPESVENVQVRQTHISIVFLAGSMAYKIKKSITLAFLDYGTPERRRFYCEEEVRLNRRLAPDVYLGVIPVTRDSGRIRLDGTGEVIDWAVRMRRLPEKDRLSSRLDAGEVGAPQLAELAQRIANFLDSAECGPEISAQASLLAIARNARENLDEATRYVGKTITRSLLDRLRIRTETEMARLGPLIDERASRDVPRDTHGDLRLDHVYWFPDRKPPEDWIAIDCIEFSQRFRSADPIADIAFLAMELSLHGRADLSEAFVNAYLVAANDKEGRALLSFYRAYRAMVRAKVESLKQEQTEVGLADRDMAQMCSRSLWLFALSELEEPNRRPCLVLVSGLPGSGKSTLSRILAEQCGFTVIRSDEVRKELAMINETSTSHSAFGEGSYTSEWNERTYNTCLQRAEELIFNGFRLIIDASFREEARRQLFLEAAHRWGIPVCLLLCKADPEIVRLRLTERHNDISDADWEIHVSASRVWEEPGPRTSPVVRRIETGGDLSVSVEQSLEALIEFGLLEEGVRLELARSNYRSTTLSLADSGVASSPGTVSGRAL